MDQRRSYQSVVSLNPINPPSKTNDCKPSISFLVKSELKKRPYTMVSVSLFITMILLGLSVRVYEM